MKVLHVTRQYYPGIGGIESVVEQLTSHLRKLGIESDILTLDRLWNSKIKLPHEEFRNGSKIIRVPFIGPRQYAVAPGILNHLGKYELIHLHSSDFLLDYLSATKFLHRKPIVLSTHGFYFHTSFVAGIKKYYFRTVTKLALQGVDQICCVSDHDRKFAIQIAPERKIRVIPNGIDISKYAASLDEKRDSNLILSVGRAASNKRLDRFLPVLKILVKKHPALRWVVLGPDWGEMEKLQNNAESLGLESNLSFLGRVDDKILKDYLERAAVWVGPTEYESFGVALLEALAAGAIPVVQPIEAFKTLIPLEEKENLFADFDHPEAAASKIGSVLNTPVENLRQTRSRLRKVAEEHDWSRVAQQMLDVYTGVT